MDSSKHLALSQTNTSLLVRDGKLSSSALSALKIPFGALKLSVEKMAPHFVVLGSPGSGKTIIQKSLMQAVLPAPVDQGGLRYRSVVYDPKRELYPYLVAIGVPPEQIIISHPFDDRSAAWDLAADFQEPAQIDELAELFVPEDQQSASENTFFHTAARIILHDVIEGLRVAREDAWTLRDITEACSSLSTLISVLQQTDNGRETAESYFSEGSSRMSESVFATVYNLSARSQHWPPFGIVPPTSSH